MPSHADRHPETAPEPTEDAFFSGQLRLLQPAKGHRAGTDAVLLAAATPLSALKIADLGAASGIVGLRAAQINPEARITLIERAQDLARLARLNTQRNGLDEHVDILEADVGTLANLPGLRENFDCVLSNPPFFEATRIRVSPNANRAGSHVLDMTLDDWVRRATGILAPRGQLVMIHRADALTVLLRTCEGRLGALRLCFIHSHPARPAIRVLISGRKGSRAPASIVPPIMLAGENGAISSALAVLNDGRARIDLETGGLEIESATGFVG
jgi:tRNA1(Val) A37 N6-methylase TrmN6